MFADYAFDYFLNKGYSPQKAAAAVGAFMQESGADLDPLAVHDNGTGMGIAGWRDEKPGTGRKTDLLNWAKENDLDPSDIDTQLDYFDHDISEGNERDVGKLLDSAQNVDDAVAAMVHYERPQGYDKADVTKANGYDNRLRYAQDLFNTYTGGGEGESLARGSTYQEDKLAQPPDMSSDTDNDVELEPYSDSDDTDSETEKTDKTSDDEESTGRRRAAKMLFAAGEKARSAASEPFDYTPGGENIETQQNWDTGIPLNAYEQFTSLYQDGGVVGNYSIQEYMKKLGI